MISNCDTWAIYCWTKMLSVFAITYNRRKEHLRMINVKNGDLDCGVVGCNPPVVWRLVTGVSV